jgi:hypothetical protein
MMVEETHRRVRPHAFCHDEQWCLPSIVVEWLYDDERMTWAVTRARSVENVSKGMLQFDVC